MLTWRAYHLKRSAFVKFILHSSAVVFSLCDVFVTLEMLCHLFLYHSLKRNQLFKMRGCLDIFKRIMIIWWPIVSEFSVVNVRSKYDSWNMSIIQFLSEWLRSISMHSIRYSLLSGLYVTATGSFFGPLKLLKKGTFCGALWTSVSF